MCAHDAIIKHHVTQAFQANKERTESEVYAIGDCIYLSTQNLTLLKGRARKLLPQYIGPYHMIDAHNEASMVTLELLDDLKNWCYAPIFYTSLIHKYEVNNDNLFLHHKAKAFYNFGLNDEEEWLINEILSHWWINSKDLEFQVQWTLGDITWEPLSSCKEPEALDMYLELHRVKKPCDLPK